MGMIVELGKRLFMKSPPKKKMTRLQKEAARINARKEAHKGTMDSLMASRGRVEVLLYEYQQNRTKLEKAERRLAKLARARKTLLNIGG